MVLPSFRKRTNTWMLLGGDLNVEPNKETV